MFSLDREILRKGTPAAGRLAALRKEAGDIEVFVPEKGVKIFALWKLWRAARAVSRARKPALVTVQDTAYLALLAYLFARAARVPLEVQVHGFEKLHGIRALLARFVLCRADRVRVVSERLKREVEARFKIHESKVYVLSIYAQIVGKDRVGEKYDTFTFLTVSRLVSVKNIALQIRAFARVVQKYSHARLHIVGDGPLLESLKSKVKSKKLEEKITFVGQQSDVSRFYREADAFLLTSDSEGWGVAVTEAAAFGLPIIMTDVGCAGEFIRNGESGIVIPVGDEAALTAAMERLITDEPFRTRLAAAARRAFEALPTPEEQIQNQIVAWRALL